MTFVDIITITFGADCLQQFVNLILFTHYLARKDNNNNKNI